MNLAAADRRHSVCVGYHHDRQARSQTLPHPSRSECNVCKGEFGPSAQAEFSRSFLFETDCIDIELQVTDVRAHDIDNVVRIAISNRALNFKRKYQFRSCGTAQLK